MVADEEDVAPSALLLVLHSPVLNESVNLDNSGKF